MNYADRLKFQQDRYRSMLLALQRQVVKLVEADLKDDYDHPQDDRDDDVALAIEELHGMLRSVDRIEAVLLVKKRVGI